jgi:hypothetical protein
MWDRETGSRSMSMKRSRFTEEQIAYALRNVEAGTPWQISMSAGR